MRDGFSTVRLGAGDAAVLARALQVLVPACRPDSRGPPLDHLAALLAGTGNYLFLAREGETGVGYLSAYRFPRVDASGTLVYLYDLEVAPDYRGRGIGRSLVEGLLQACRADGVEMVWAGTAIDNAAARRTFEAVGGRRVSESYLEYEFRLRDREG